MFILLFSLSAGVEWLLIIAYLFLIGYTIRRAYKKFEIGRLSLPGFILLILLTILVPVIGPLVANLILMK